MIDRSGLGTALPPPTGRKMSHFYKDRANALDMRSLQEAVLWEWAIATGLPLKAAAKQFSEKYRSFWPLIQLGDPLIQNDRMFDVDEQNVHKLLVKLEQYYGKYTPASSTDSSLLFQHVSEVIAKHPLGSGPVWCKDTRSPRDHAEHLLNKYGVSTCLPSQSPSTLMIKQIYQARLVMSDDRLLNLAPAVRVTARLSIPRPLAFDIAAPARHAPGACCSPIVRRSRNPPFAGPHV